MSSQRRNYKTEQILIVLSVLVCAVSVGLIVTYEKFFVKFATDPDDVIAKVESTSRTAKRRIPTGFEFQDLKQSDGLGNGDYIFSGDGSSVLLKFNNGPRIMLGENSLIVLREIDGTPELRVENGAFSGSFQDSDTVEVMTKKDIVILNGDKDATFSVAFLPGVGLQIASFDHEVKIEYNGKKMAIKNQKATVSKDRGIEVSSGDTSGNKSRDTASTSKPLEMPKGLEVETMDKDTAVAFNPPYPQNNQMFFHTKGGSIPVFPKKACTGTCEIKLFVNGKEAAAKTFDRDKIPLINLKVQADTEAQVRWEFSDGGQKTDGSFQILHNNKANFQKAFATKSPVEIMN